MTDRPVWTHTLSEDFARWLWRHPVDSITTEMEWHSEDRADVHIVFVSGKARKRAPANIFQSREVCFGARSYLIWLEGRVSKTLEEMDRYDKQHAKEIAEYKRLAKKYHGVNLAKIEDGEVAP